MGNKFTFEEAVGNAIDCLKYWEQRVDQYVKELNESSTSEDENAMEDTQKAIAFLLSLEEIIGGACVLATYAGEDWGIRPLAYDFGADSYGYLGKYIDGGMELAKVFGTEDFYNDYMDYFNENIKPIVKENNDEGN